MNAALAAKSRPTDIPKDVSPLERVLDKLAGKINIAAELAARLDEKLEPLADETCPIPCEQTESPHNASLIRSLSNEADRLSAVNIRLESLLTRLAL